MDKEKCKLGIEIPMSMGAGMMDGEGIFGSAGTPSTSPQRTPWAQGETPGYTSAWSPGKAFRLFSFC